MPELVDTPHGPARVHLQPAAGRARAALVLGHGAGGGVAARDLVAAHDVAGRRSPAPARQLDAAWVAVVAHLRAGALAGLPLIAGGRSAGARVACRTAAETGAVAVLCLAFPLHPPGRPAQTRQAELDAVDVPVLVVQGAQDPFGIPPAGPGRDVVTVPGTHGLTTDLDAVRAAVRAWLTDVRIARRSRR